MSNLGKLRGDLPLIAGFVATKMIAGTVAAGGVLIAQGITDATSDDVYSPPEQEGDKGDSPNVHY